MSDQISLRQARLSSTFARAVGTLAAMVFVKWLAIALEIGIKDAPHYFLFFFSFTFLIAIAIRNRFPRISGVMGFLFSLWYCTFMVSSFLEGFSGWKWYEYMVTFIGLPLGVLILGLSVRMVIRK